MRLFPPIVLNFDYLYWTTLILVVILVEQVSDVSLVIVMILEPAAVNPTAVKVPVPAVLTVKFAVNAVALGLLLL